jgi:predicted RNA binding protein YcfA (HicA-like mRNA interferase family)
MPKGLRLTAAEAEAMMLRAGFAWLRSRGSHRIYQKHARRVVEFRSIPASRCTRRSLVLEAIEEAPSGVA